MSYIVVFAVLLAVYTVGVLLSEYLAKYKAIVNLTLVMMIFASYFYIVRYMYYDVGVNDWNFKNTLPTANVSPFMFNITLVVWILPKAIRKYFMTLI